MDFPLSGSVAVVTGAAGGIGAELAVALAQHGVSLALVDIDRVGLETTRKRVNSHARSVTTHHADMADVGAIGELVAEIEAAHERVNLLINNAGMTVLGKFEDTTSRDFEYVMAVNFSAPVALTRALLPTLKREDKAQILNMSSLFGLVGAPGQSAYCASKFALRGFSEALRFDLAGTGVGVTVVHPGGVRTNIAKSAIVRGFIDPSNQDPQKYAERFLKLGPDKVAAILVQAIRRRKHRVVIGSDARVVSLAQRLFPGSYQRLVSVGMK